MKGSKIHRQKARWIERASKGHVKGHFKEDNVALAEGGHLYRLHKDLYNCVCVCVIWQNKAALWCNRTQRMNTLSSGQCWGRYYETVASRDTS